jgi:hypothetical protein
LFGNPSYRIALRYQRMDLDRHTRFFWPQCGFQAAKRFVCGIFSGGVSFPDVCGTLDIGCSNRSTGLYSVFGDKRLPSQRPF